MIAIFLWKQFKYHRYNWKVKLFNIVLPIFAGFAIVIILYQTEIKHLKECEYISFNWYIPVVLFLQSIACINLVMLPIVEEKSSGVKEFLSISCRHSHWNLITFFVLQVMIHFSIFGVVFLLAWNLSMNDHFDMVYMLLLIFLYIVANVLFTFALSVMFNTG